MSKPNKVNKDHYTQRGRLTPDEFARERARDIQLVSAQRRINERTRRTTARRGEQESSPDRTEREAEE
jgi:hypothetical protein